MGSRVTDKPAPAARPPGRPLMRKLVPHPFVHLDTHSVQHPITGSTLRPDDADYEVVRSLADGASTADAVASPVRERLARERWLIDAEYDPAAEFRLRFVSLELHSVCNDACWFCPVSVAPREREFMSDETTAAILDQLAAHQATIDAVFMNNYNEPTIDPRFVDQVAAIKARGLPIALLTNGSGLSPDRIDAIVASGGLRFLGVNLSSIEPERALAQRRSRHLAPVLRNLDHAARLPVAEQMKIVVLGDGDAEHDRAIEQISARFDGTRFQVEAHRVMDRAGYFSFGARPEVPHAELRGCQNLGSRPLEHLHITATGLCVFCCEDFDEQYVVGDLMTETVDQVLRGPALAELRRISYGLSAAPDNFICRSCVFARTPTPPEQRAAKLGSPAEPASVSSA